LTAIIPAGSVRFRWGRKRAQALVEEALPPAPQFAARPDGNLDTGREADLHVDTC
jgi:hypothetical protein